MRASTSTSERSARVAAACLAGALLCIAFAAVLPSPALAQDDPAAEGTRGATEKAEEDDFQSTPYTEYADFNESEEEEAAVNFFQHGRFFGVSIGGGIHDVTGNRGLIWKGGFPFVNIKLHAWFDLNMGVQLFFSTAQHNYSVEGEVELMDVSLLMFGADFKYYIGTQDVSAPVTFANPYLLVGGGSFTKNEFDVENGVLTPDNGFGLDFGFGLEFAVTPRKTYFSVEAKAYMITYSDTNNDKFTAAGVPDLTGLFYSVSGNVMFTW